jgi:hypothetical protein
MRRQRIVGLAVIAGVAWSTAAAVAAELTPAYLDGRWTTGAAENCTRADHEQTVFRSDGTFATEHNGRALAVGFFRIEDDRIDMQVLTTEASLPQALQDQLPGEYHAIAVRGLVFDVTDNAFRLVQGIQGELRGVNMVRCPAA